ncbi:hypothetical protein HY571_02315 [Candidatus Micrarchaeota archaeon]|nr:hypothetical protein [Candidatus Micrarchaeota archaeon]
MEFTLSRKVAKPLPVRVILARPEYEINIGMAARAAKNFSITDLALVEPCCSVGFEAAKYAKHSKEVIDNMRKFSSLNQAVEGFDLVVGTTGVVKRFTGSLKHCVSLSEAAALVKGKKVAVVFGPEGTGLTEQEFNRCDVVIHIPAEKAHPVLNLSHAVAVTLYGLFYAGKKTRQYKKAERHNVDYLLRLFDDVVDELGEKTVPRLRAPAKAKTAFRRILGRSRPADAEVQTLFTVFSRIRRLVYNK